MDIENLSKSKREIVVTLDADELVKICNMFCRAQGEKDDKYNEKYDKLYSEMMLARDLCQYGHIDDFCLEKIIEHRKNIKK